MKGKKESRMEKGETFIFFTYSRNAMFPEKETKPKNRENTTK